MRVCVCSRALSSTLAGEAVDVEVCVLDSHHLAAADLAAAFAHDGRAATAGQRGGAAAAVAAVVVVAAASAIKNCRKERGEMGTVSSHLTKQGALKGLIAHCIVVSTCPFGGKVKANLSHDVGVEVTISIKGLCRKNHFSCWRLQFHCSLNPTWPLPALNFTQVSQKRLCVIPKTANRGHKHDDLT